MKHNCYDDVDEIWNQLECTSDTWKKNISFLMQYQYEQITKKLYDSHKS